MNNIKTLGQVMTPNHIVQYMIELLHLTEQQKKEFLFLDNSCGDGSFIKGLLEIGVPKEHIYAGDIDPEISAKVRELLPRQNYQCGSAFDVKWEYLFDVVIGNPPFVRIHNIDSAIKKNLTKYQFCIGMYDLYYAFFELGINQIKPNGILLYITPSSYVKNASGSKLRQYIDDNKMLVYYEDFANNQQFKSFSTYTAITMLQKNHSLITSPWYNSHSRVGLSFSVLQNGIATLADKIFIQNDFSFLEAEMVRPIIKASTGEKKMCIYPHYTKMTEADLQKYPKTYEYLLSHQKDLLKRSITGSTQWFEYGRSQGLKQVEEEKIAISTTVSFDGLSTIRVPAGTLVYSGLYATATNLDILEEQLQSPLLLDYLIEKGKPMSGNYVQVGSTLFKQY